MRILSEYGELLKKSITV